MTKKRAVVSGCKKRRKTNKPPKRMAGKKPSANSLFKALLRRIPAIVERACPLCNPR